PDRGADAAERLPAQLGVDPGERLGGPPAHEFASVFKDPTLDECPPALATAPGLEPGPTIRRLKSRPFRRHNLPVTSRVTLPRSRPKQKRPSRGLPLKAWFSMSADPLGRFALLAAIEDAAVMPVAGFRREPRQTPGQSHRDAAR